MDKWVTLIIGSRGSGGSEEFRRINGVSVWFERASAEARAMFNSVSHIEGIVIQEIVDVESNRVLGFSIST